MSLKLISKHRSAIMAIAMIWIGFYHSCFPFENRAISFILARCGYGGVDIFLFLSSFGLYFAYKKNSDYLSFLKRRLVRILPYSIPLVIIVAIVYKTSLLTTIIDCLGLSLYFRGDLTFWYTSFILTLYILTPLYLKLFRKNELLTTIIGMLLVFAVSLVVKNDDFVYVFFRTSVFILGFYFAYLLDSKKKIPAMAYVITVAIMVIGWLLIYVMFHYFRNDFNHVYPFLLITPGLVLLLSWIIEKTKFLDKPLSFLGAYSYQFYLIHSYVVAYVNTFYGMLYKPGIGFDWLINAAEFIIAVVVAIIYKKIIDVLLARTKLIEKK